MAIWFSKEITVFSHGRTKSVRRGVADAMMGTSDNMASLPVGHEDAYKQGYVLGLELKQKIAEAEKPSPENEAEILG